VPKGKAVPQETLLDAATLAVRFSQLREAAGGPVVYCARHHVTKPRGAKPGQVLYSQSKTLHVTVERSRVDRLFRREG
jgi:predicted ribosome quality control (RQC) complex YloA/Tae2 family protein